MAAECLAAARQTTDARVRMSLVDIAQKWLDLAELCEHEGYNKACDCARLRRVSAKNFGPSLSRPTAYSPF